jgi:hypothetical protein
MAISLSKITGKSQTQPVAPRPANDQATSAAIRRAFKASAIPEVIPLTPLTGLGTSRQRFDVAMTGLCYMIRIIVHAEVTVIGGAAGDCTWSATGPWSMFSNSYFQDSAGIPRIDTQPFYLMLRRLMYQSFGLDLKNSTYLATGTQPLDVTPAYQAPLKTAATPGVVNDILFSWDLPLTIHAEDLQGLVDLSTPGRKAQLGVTLNPAGLTGAVGALDDTFAINIKAASAATATLTGVKVMAQQYIYGLQGVLNGKVVDLPIPQADMDVIHEIATKNKPALSTSVQGTFETLDINRTYISAIQSWFFNSQMTLGQADGIATRPDATAVPKGLLNVWMKYSGNKKPIDEPISSYVFYLADKYGRVMPPGNTFYDWRRKPWNADWVDVLQIGAQLDSGANTSGETFVDTTTEGLYTGTTSDSVVTAGATT